ncbi:unnamed protein product [Lampetra fluviatilis]
MSNKDACLPLLLLLPLLLHVTTPLLLLLLNDLEWPDSCSVVRARPPSSSVDRVLPSPGGKAARARDGRGHRVCCSPARPPRRRLEHTHAGPAGGGTQGRSERSGSRGEEVRQGDRRDEARMDIARRDNDSCKPKEQSVTVRGEEK